MGHDRDQGGEEEACRKARKTETSRDATSTRGLAGASSGGPAAPDTTTLLAHRDVGQSTTGPCEPDNVTPSQPDSFLESGCGPGMDLRLLAPSLGAVPWGEVERWLPKEFADLRFAATARTFKNLRVKMSELMAHLQTVQAALFIVDTAAAQKKDTGGTTPTAWDWETVHIDATRERRYLVLAWHIVAVRVDDVMHCWGVTDATKARFIKDTLQERLGLGLVVSDGWLPELGPKRSTRLGHLQKCMPDGVPARLNLAGYQRRAAVALPADIAVHRALVGHLEGTKDGQASCWIRGPGDMDNVRAVELPDWGGGPSAVLYMQEEMVVAVFDPRGIIHDKVKRQSGSNWIHPAINWKRTGDDEPSPCNAGCKALPEFDVTRVARRANTWLDRLPDVGMAARTILEGRLSLPMKNSDVPSLDARNHGTCDENPAVIDAIVAEYLISGVLEFCPPGHAPLCISALGLVPKRTAPFFRLIVDLRPVNKHFADWRTHMAGIAANAMIFNPGAVAFTRDLKAAYLLSALGGCDPGLHGHKRPRDGMEHVRMKAPGERRRWVGCTPESCLGHCNKAMLGIRWREHLFRYAAPCFGSKHGGNVLETLLAPVLRKLKGFGCNVTSWVDDIICVVENRGGPGHDPATCGGEHGCEHCADTFRRAREVEALVDSELDRLGLLTSDKNAPPSQSGEFLGLWWDTVQGAFRLQPEKAATLAAGGGGAAAGIHGVAALVRGMARQDAMVLGVPGRGTHSHTSINGMDRSTERR
jgi:hypothetical protein